MKPMWLEIAILELGQAEVPGSKVNPRLVAYNSSVGFTATDDEVPWCAAFACWCIEKAGLVSPRSAAARSFLHWGIELENPREGCLVVLWRDDKNSWQGHVGFYCSEDTSMVKILGGNQANKVSVASYPKSKILGYRWPKRK